jgi:hypothetical protein
VRFSAKQLFCQASEAFENRRRKCAARRRAEFQLSLLGEGAGDSLDHG